MSATAIFLNMDEERVVLSLQEATSGLDGVQGEVVLDFSSVRRLDSGALLALEEFVQVADEKALKIVLRGVNVHMYKVLKLVKLTPRFSFVD